MIDTDQLLNGRRASSEEDFERSTKSQEPCVRPEDPTSDAIRGALSIGLHWLRINETSARDGQVKGVHFLRTTTRRLRTALDLFRNLTDPAWADHLIEELKWLAHLLGEVRDLDVMKMRLEVKARELDELETLSPLFQGLCLRHAEASERLVEGLRSERFDALKADLTEATAVVPLSDGANEPCGLVLPTLVDEAWTILRKAARALTEADPDEAYHRVRKLAKRARYAAEAVSDSLEPDAVAAAKRFARCARGVQDVLGEHQDAVVALSEIRRAAEAHPELGPFNFAAGRLAEREFLAATSAREGFKDVWSRLNRKKLVRWLKP